VKPGGGGQGSATEEKSGGGEGHGERMLNAIGSGRGARQSAASSPILLKEKHSALFSYTFQHEINNMTFLAKINTNSNCCRRKFKPTLIERMRTLRLKF
jgi:hypothetical protein